jgi:hypothetical protein
VTSASISALSRSFCTAASSAAAALDAASATAARIVNPGWRHGMVIS